MNKELPHSRVETVSGALYRTKTSLLAKRLFSRTALFNREGFYNEGITSSVVQCTQIDTLKAATFANNADMHNRFLLKRNHFRKR